MGQLPVRCNPRGNRAALLCAEDPKISCQLADLGAIEEIRRVEGEYHDPTAAGLGRSYEREINRLIGALTPNAAVVYYAVEVLLL